MPGNATVGRDQPRLNQWQNGSQQEASFRIVACRLRCREALKAKDKQSCTWCEVAFRFIGDMRSSCGNVNSPQQQQGTPQVWTA